MCRFAAVLLPGRRRSPFRQDRAKRSSPRRSPGCLPPRPRAGTPPRRGGRPRRRRRGPNSRARRRSRPIFRASRSPRAASNGCGRWRSRSKWRAERLRARQHIPARDEVNAAHGGDIMERPFHGGSTGCAPGGAAVRALLPRRKGFGVRAARRLQHGQHLADPGDGEFVDQPEEGAGWERRRSCPPWPSWRACRRSFRRLGPRCAIGADRHP